MHFALITNQKKNLMAPELAIKMKLSAGRGAIDVRWPELGARFLIKNCFVPHLAPNSKWWQVCYNLVWLLITTSCCTAAQQQQHVLHVCQSRPGEIIDDFINLNIAYELLSKTKRSPNDYMRSIQLELGVCSMPHGDGACSMEMEHGAWRWRDTFEW